MELISIQSINFLLSAAWLYILCTKVIVNYYICVADELQNIVIDNNSSLENIVRSMKLFKQLACTTHLLHERFGFILMTGCIYLLAFCVQSMYYLTRYANEKFYGIVSFWDCFSLTEAMFRILLISYSADSIKSAVSFKLLFIAN